VKLPLPHRRVVVFGVDGVRHDTLEIAATPRIHEIAAAGFLSRFEVGDHAPTLCGPCWATVATGVWPDRHAIVGNHFGGHRLAAFPDFLTQLRRANPAFRTYAVANWPPLVGAYDGGPLFAGATRLVGVDAYALGYPEADRQVTEDAALTLGTRDVHAAFVYLGAVDEVGHQKGTGDEYISAVERADVQIGQIIDAIRGRPAYRTEEWTFIVVTDHGHRDGGGHGQRSEWERTAWIAACGPDVPMHAHTSHVDVHPSVLAALGVEIDPRLGLAGVPFSEA
jgi:predicted AlkP superfamily pyrophosphatase or phosphodiesterase